MARGSDRAHCLSPARPQIPRWLRAAGVSKLSFVGGEPLLHPHLGALLAEAKAAGLVTSVITNGSLLSAERLLRLHGEPGAHASHAPSREQSARHPRTRTCLPARARAPLLFSTGRAGAQINPTRKACAGVKRARARASPLRLAVPLPLSVARPCPAPATA
jgi:hypothetical protein